MIQVYTSSVAESPAFFFHRKPLAPLSSGGSHAEAAGSIDVSLTQWQKVQWFQWVSNGLY